MASIPFDIIARDDAAATIARLAEAIKRIPDVIQIQIEDED